MFCEMIQSERQQRVRWVHETENFVAICPYASRVAYETWILPSHHRAHFEAAEDGLLRELASLMHAVVGQLDETLNYPAFNYVLHTSPFDTTWKDHYHWHIEIIPRIARIAGLEFGTGVHINTVPPESAADQLQKLVKDC